MPVASQHRKRRGEQQRRTLELLAAAGSDGLHESLLVHGYGIPVEVLVRADQERARVHDGRGALPTADQGGDGEDHGRRARGDQDASR
jgi:hypothetical protein